jgi:hypothetical protein
MKIGTRVKALKRLTEENFMGAALHVHAEPGDIGEVVDVDDTWITVRFQPSDTATGCAPEEIKAAEQEAA